MTDNAGRRRFGPGSISNQPQNKPEQKPPKKESKPKAPIVRQDEETEEEVDLKGFQVVRREFFAHTREPSIIFNDGKISVNTVFHGAIHIHGLSPFRFRRFLIFRGLLLGTIQIQFRIQFSQPRTLCFQFGLLRERFP